MGWEVTKKGRTHSLTLPLLPKRASLVDGARGLAVDMAVPEASGTNKVHTLY